MTPTVTQPEAFTSLLLTCSLKGTMFLLLVGMLALWTRSASCRHFVWICGFLCLGALMLLDPFVPHWQVLPSWETSPIVAAIKPWLLPIWCVGALLFCAKVLLGLLALLRIERSSSELASDPWESIVSECRQDLGINRKVRLLHFPGRIMPMTWGVLRNFVVLPSSAARWSGQRVRAVLMHELAHIRRGDYIASLLRDAVCAFYWFHPLVWWAAREMDEDREEASDDAVIAAGQRPADYASHLATVATRGLVINPQIRPKVALAEKPLLMRVRSILTPWKSRHPITGMQRFQLGTALVLMLTSLLLIGPRQPLAESSLSQNSLSDAPKQLAYVSTGFGGSAQEFTSSSSRDQTPQTVFGWSASEQDWGLEGALISQTGSDGNQSAANQDLPVHIESGTSISSNTTTNLAGADTADSSLLGQANNTEKEEPTWVITAPAYSTSPPEESDEGPEAISLSELLESLDNVDRIALNDFDLGGLGDKSDSGNVIPDDFDLGDFQFDQGVFSVASLTKSLSKVPNATVKQAPLKDTYKKVTATDQGTTRRAPLPEFEVESQTRPDAGLLTQVRLVPRISTGKPHLAITFRRKANSPTATFRFQASPDMAADNWAVDPVHFVLIDVRRVNGIPEATIALDEPISVSPFRFLRIRSSSAVPQAPQTRN